jgi:hypothetical protein
VSLPASRSVLAAQGFAKVDDSTTTLAKGSSEFEKRLVQHENKDLYQQDYADSTVTESRSSTRSMSISRTAELYSPGPDTTTRQGWGIF